MNNKHFNGQILRPERTGHFNPMATPWERTNVSYSGGLKAQLNLPIQGKMSIIQLKTQGVALLAFGLN